MKQKINEMMEEKNNNQKPRMTKELLVKFNEKLAQLESMEKDNLTPDQQLLDEVNHYKCDYNWMSYVFEGEDGKVGMMNIAGEVLVPARYDDFLCTYDYNFKIPAIPALKNGKCGLVKSDGSGTELTDFVYDDMQAVEWDYSFYYRKNGSKQFGILLADGTEALPCCLDFYDARINDVIVIGGNGKEGAFLPRFDVVIPPKFDSVEIPDDLESEVIFTLDGVPGYVDYDGNFISKAEYEQLENSGDDAQYAKYEEWSGKVVRGYVE